MAIFDSTLNKTCDYVLYKVLSFFFYGHEYKIFEKCFGGNEKRLVDHISS